MLDKSKFKPKDGDKVLKVSNVKIPYNKNEDDYIFYVAKKLKISTKSIVSCHLLKKSLDARKPGDIHYVCTFKIRAKGEGEIIKRKGSQAVRYTETPYRFPYSEITSDVRPVICGTGPSGLFCALMLARAGIKPIILERGEKVDQRTQTIETFKEKGILNLNSNIQFGEGGAGTFSDGKLTCGVNDVRMAFVLKEFAAHGAPKDILTNGLC